MSPLTGQGLELLGFQNSLMALWPIGQPHICLIVTWTHSCLCNMQSHKCLSPQAVVMSWEFLTVNDDTAFAGEPSQNLYNNKPNQTLMPPSPRWTGLINANRLKLKLSRAQSQPQDESLGMKKIKKLVWGNIVEKKVDVVLSGEAIKAIKNHVSNTEICFVI